MATAVSVGGVSQQADKDVTGSSMNEKTEKGGSDETTTAGKGWFSCFRSKKSVEPENLTEAVNEERNWKSIAVALLVIIVICTLIVVAIVLTTPATETKNYGTPMTFQDIYNSSYQTNDIRAQWVGDILFYRARSGDLMSIDPVTNTTRLQLAAQYFNDKKASDYSVSADHKYVVLKWRVTPKYRHSSDSLYTVYNLATLQSVNIVPPSFGTSAEVPLQFFQWTPSNVSNALVFVYQNNIYYMSAVSASPVQVTTSGDSKIFNGVPDWLYEEEIIGGPSVIWWSRSGTIIAYAEIDDRNVTVFEMARYINASQTYPVTDHIPYPKAGERRPNNTPVVAIHVHNLASNTPLRTFSPPDSLASGLNYILTSIAWFDDNAFLLEWANRQQTQTLAHICMTNNGTCVQSLKVDAIPIDIGGSTVLRGWVDADGRRFYPVTPTSSQNYPYITTSLHTVSTSQGADVYRQASFVGGLSKVGGLPRVTPLSMRTSTSLSSGSEVDDVIAVDSDRRIAYYTAPRDNDAKTTHLFSASWTDVGEGADSAGSKCLTCEFNETCDVVSARFSKSARYYLLQCSGPGIPATILKTAEGVTINVMEDNAPLKQNIPNIMMPRIVYQQLQLSDGRLVDAELMLPPWVNEQHYIPHPLLVYVYAGPESRGVMKRWKSVGWMHYLVTAHGVVVASVDGRGTGGRGRKNAYWLYRNLGTLEIRDQILAIEAMKQFSYIDKAKIAAQGSSYGGYATLHMLANASSVVPCGIALAPVTDWAYYDTAYTERFMDLYSNNELGYSKGSLLETSKIEGIKKGVLLLAHGTGDHNVHMQNSLNLIKLLTEAEAQFDLQIYTDMEHNLRVGLSGRQLTQKMINFLLDCYSNKT